MAPCRKYTLKKTTGNPPELSDFILVKEDIREELIKGGAPFFSYFYIFGCHGIIFI